MASDRFGGAPAMQPPGPFGCVVERAADLLIIRLRGEFDIGAIAEFRDALTAATTHGVEQVIVDLRELTFIDSTGLTAIIGLRATLPRARLTLVRGPEPVQRVFDYAGLTGQLAFVDAPTAEADTRRLA